MRNNKVVSAIIAFVIAGVLAVGVCCLGFASRGNDGKWFGGFKDLSSWHWSDKTSENKPDIPDIPDTPDNPDESYGGNTAGGAMISDDESYGISLLNEEIPVEDYAANGISPQADTAFTLTATVDSDDPDLSVLDWIIAFKNASSSWASGKSVTDYVTISVAPNTLSATLSCSQAFGEQIQVTVKAVYNMTASATCTVDYVKRVTGLTHEFSSTGKNCILTTGSDKTIVTFTPTYGVGTVEPTSVSVTSLSLHMNAGKPISDQLISYATSIGYDCTVPSTFSVSYSGSGLNVNFILKPQMYFSSSDTSSAKYKLMCNKVIDILNSHDYTNHKFYVNVDVVYNGKTVQSATNLQTGIFMPQPINATKYTVVGNVNLSDSNVAI